MNELTAVILAGGKNSRIQKEKSLIEINRKHILASIIEVLETIFSNILIVSSKQELIDYYKDIQFCEDIYTESGPLGGIHSALSNASGQGIFVFACDMPNLNESIIRAQISLCKENIDVVIPQHVEGIEPLHAIYSKRCLPFIEEQLKKGDFSVRGFFDYVNVEYFNVNPRDSRYFYNINTQHDLEIFLANQYVK